MKKIVISEKLHPDGMALFAARDDIDTHYLDGDKSKLQEALYDANALLIRTMTLSESDLTGAKNIEVISRHGVGCDNIDVACCSQHNIPVAIAVDSNTTSVIEHVLMMMLALNKRAFQYDRFTREGNFSERSKHHTSELHGKHVLIVGFGRIGKRIAPLCKAFGMRVTVADIKLDREYAAEIGVEAVEDFRPLLGSADYLTVHVPLDESTRHLIGSEELKALPSHSIVINCARGGIVDEHALASAIHDGEIAATGADVFTVEPPAPDNPLIDLPNSIFTPHNAAGTAESLCRMATYSAQNILDHFDGKLTADKLINPEVFGSS